MRICAVPGCPTAYADRNTHCPAHRRQADRARGTRQARGYDRDHDRLRADWAPKVATGAVTCWRCGDPITRGEPWHLGHDDNDRTTYRGPEHELCNLSAAGKSAHK